MDSVTDSIVTGRRFRALVIVDDYSRECPTIEVDTLLGGHRVVQVLERLAGSRIAGFIRTTTESSLSATLAGIASRDWRHELIAILDSHRPEVDSCYSQKPLDSTGAG
jgi:putative transposase